MFGIAAELYKTDKYRDLKWYRLADFAGDYDAALAVYHIVTEDLSFEYNIIFNHFAARRWYEKAAEFGNINAAKNLVMMYAPDKKKSLYWLNKVLEPEVGHKND